jgi:hypothetical protein
VVSFAQWEPTGDLTVADSLAFPAFITAFAAAMHAAMPPLELHVYAGWEHQPAVKRGCAAIRSNFSTPVNIEFI